MYKAVLIVFFITVMITYFFANYTGEAQELNNLKETWESYKKPPYGYVSTGADPIYYYRHDRFRKPYRWPLTFSSSYPYPHQEPLP